MTQASPAPEAETHTETIARLGRLIDGTLSPVADGIGGAPYVLLDFPDHANVGDSAIWLGETAWLRRRLGRMPAYVCRQEADWTALERASGDGVILLHGGGNFGDIWPVHQMFRESVLRRYRGRPVVQFPQSIHYGDESVIERTARAIGEHGAFTLFVRDEESLDLARRRFDCESRLCPDMAFCLGPRDRPVEPAIPVLLLLRTDKERRSSAIDRADLPAGWEIDDWLVDEAGFEAKARRRSRIDTLASLDPHSFTRTARDVRLAETLASFRLDRGLAMLSRARFIVTDRLHVHILSTLLGIPHVFLDNSYGKIGRFSRTFSTGWTGVRRAETLDEAMDVARKAHGIGPDIGIDVRKA